MAMQRPDLSKLAPEIVAYIEALEEQLDTLRQSREDDEDEPNARSNVPLEPSEPPTTMNVITVSAAGFAKRTRRHHYLRQRRGGMGVFDLETGLDDPPAFLVIADENAGLLLITNQGRAFRLLVRDLPETPIRGRGQSVLEEFPLRPNEKLAIVAPDQGGAYLVLVSERGQVRRIGNQYLGKNLQPGTVLYNISEGGAPVAATWSSGNDELFIASRQGKAIRFSERLVPVRGCLGMRVDPDDVIVTIAAAKEDGGVFLISGDGKGTIRLLSGFTGNKSPGAGGKVAMKTDALVGSVAVDDTYDVFAISKLAKIIRFQAAETPAKEGVVQGVNCMNLRGDLCTVFTACSVTPTS